MDVKEFLSWNLEEGDLIEYEGQVGVVSTIWEYEIPLYTLILRNPDRKITTKNRKKIKLLCYTG